MNILARGFIYRLLFMALSFGISLLIARLAGAALFGTISLLIVNAAVIQIITGLGTDAAIVWHGARGGEAFHPQALSFTLLTAILQVFIFIIIAIGFFKIDGRCILTRDPRAGIFYAELLYFTGLVFLEKFTSLLYSQQRAGLCNRFLAMITFLFLILLFADTSIEVFGLSDNLLWFFCLMTFIQAVFLGGIYFSRFPFSLQRLSREDARSLINFSLVVFFANLIQFLAYRADYWFVDYYHDVNAVGVYAQANRFAQLLWVVPNVVSSLVIPLMAARDKAFGLNHFNRLLRVIIPFSVFLVIVIVSLSWFIYGNFLPDEYYPGFNALLLMIPGYILFTIALLLAAFFSSERKLWINFRGSFICFITIIIADFILIPEWGIRGAAISNTIAYSVTALYFVYVFVKHTDTRFSELFSFRREDFKELLKTSGGK